MITMKALIFFLTAVLLAASEDILDVPNGCPKNWAHLNNRMSYILFEQNRTQTDANEFCKSQKGHLLSLWSKEEREFIETYILNGTNSQNQTKIWIGMLAPSYRGYNWEWLDTSSQNNLINILPKVTTTSCLAAEIVDGNICYVPHHCNDKLPFICKRSCYKVYRAGLPWDEFDITKNISSYEVFEDRFRSSWFYPLYDPNLGYNVNYTEKIDTKNVFGDSRCAFECLQEPDCVSFITECLKKRECMTSQCHLLRFIK
ncbi:DgyrCDS969 [Dimorphilus gyrociliatus]|uniref:DgyrCDS969 n=1 Tax=Dimorphilus gyrociliatus TaxID=2664684 RepID=A0A7I8V631_9ANNE|nr:DgyrCDS969 [Dimorphilus gyrociliatus]